LGLFYACAFLPPSIRISFILPPTPLTLLRRSHAPSFSRSRRLLVFLCFRILLPFILSPLHCFLSPAFILQAFRFPALYSLFAGRIFIFFYSFFFFYLFLLFFSFFTVSLFFTLAPSGFPALFRIPCFFNYLIFVFSFGLVWQLFYVGIHIIFPLFLFPLADFKILLVIFCSLFSHFMIFMFISNLFFFFSFFLFPGSRLAFLFRSFRGAHFGFAPPFKPQPAPFETPLSPPLFMPLYPLRSRALSAPRICVSHS